MNWQCLPNLAHRDGSPAGASFGYHSSACGTDTFEQISIRESSGWRGLRVRVFLARTANGTPRKPFPRIARRGFASLFPAPRALTRGWAIFLAAPTEASCAHIYMQGHDIRDI